MQGSCTRAIFFSLEALAPHLLEQLSSGLSEKHRATGWLCSIASVSPGLLRSPVLKDLARAR